MSNPERVAEILAKIKAKPARPKVVVSDGQPTADAAVRVSPADPNARNADSDGTVRVRRREYITINEAAWERQEAEKAQRRWQQRELDPFNYGHWGRRED